MRPGATARDGRMTPERSSLRARDQNDRQLASLRTLVPYAPLHMPAELSVIEAVSKRYPKLPQVVCFDTAFHRGMPELARRLPLPRALYDAGIRRYGFHGLS